MMIFLNHTKKQKNAVLEIASTFSFSLRPNAFLAVNPLNKKNEGKSRTRKVEKAPFSTF